MVTVWTAESRDEEGKPVRDPGSITYSAAIESAAATDTSPKRSDLAERVLREATRRGFTEASRCVVLGDGSTWIWNTATELFPQAIQILDRYHAKEALHRTAQSIFGATSAEAKPWATARCTELDEGKLQAIIQRAPTPYRLLRRSGKMCHVHFSQPPSHALSEVPRAGFVHLHRRPGGRMQSSDRNPAQTRRHALERLWRQRHHRSSLRQAQWTFRGFLGAPLTAA